MNLTLGWVDDRKPNKAINAVTDKVGVRERNPTYATVKLKHIADHISRGDTPSYVETSNIQVVNQACVSSEGLDLSRVKYQNEEALEKISSWIKKNDILVNSTGTGTLGRVAIFDHNPSFPSFADAHVTIVRDKRKRFYPRYIFHVLSINQKHITALCSVGSTNQIELNRAKFSNFLVPCPSLSQQRQISEYLDRHTDKIDALIAAQKRLLELLTEKRQALITHAVTCGLNSDAPMKYSGIEWLGRIPEHWQVKKLRWFVQSLEQGWSPQANEKEPSEDEWGVLKLNAVKDGLFDESKAKTLPKDIEIPKELEIKSGDFLITRANTPELVGDICYISETRRFLILSDLIYRLRLKENQLDGQFLKYFLLSSAGRVQIKSDARGSSNSMVKISQRHILDWWIALPPPDEQIEIVKSINSQIAKIYALKAELEKKAIPLLQERRTSLISAAVTGQLEISE